MTADKQPPKSKQQKTKTKKTKRKAKNKTNVAKVIKGKLKTNDKKKGILPVPSVC